MELFAAACDSSWPQAIIAVAGLLVLGWILR